MRSRPRNARLIAAAVVSLTALTLSCLGDTVEPPPSVMGQFAIRPSFQAAAADIVPLAAAHITLERIVDSTRVIDTTIAIAAGDTTVDLSLTVVMLSSTAQFRLRTELITPGGDTAFRAGPTLVSPGAVGTSAVPVVGTAGRPRRGH